MPISKLSETDQILSNLVRTNIDLSLGQVLRKVTVTHRTQPPSDIATAILAIDEQLKKLEKKDNSLKAKLISKSLGKNDFILQLKNQLSLYQEANSNLNNISEINGRMINLVGSTRPVFRKTTNKIKQLVEAINQTYQVAYGKLTKLSAKNCFLSDLENSLIKSAVTAIAEKIKLSSQDVIYLSDVVNDCAVFSKYIPMLKDNYKIGYLLFTVPSTKDKIYFTLTDSITLPHLAPKMCEVHNVQEVLDFTKKLAPRFGLTF